MTTVDDGQPTLTELTALVEDADDPLDRLEAIGRLKKRLVSVEADAVRECRAAEVTWTTIGAHLGVTKQGAAKRYGDCLVPGLMEALIPRKDESHGSTEEVPRGASGAGDQDGRRSAA